MWTMMWICMTWTQVGKKTETERDAKEGIEDMKD